MRWLIGGSWIGLCCALLPAVALAQVNRDSKFDIASLGPPAPAIVRGTFSQDVTFEQARHIPNVEFSLGSGSSRFNRPMSCSRLSSTGSSAPFQAVRLYNKSANLATLNLRLGLAGDPHAACGAFPDTMIAVYDGVFIPGSPLTNCIEISDDADGAFDRCSSMKGVEVPPGATRVVVLTTFSSDEITSKGRDVKLELSFAGSVPVELQSFTID